VPHNLLLDNLELVDRVVRDVCRQHRVSDTDAEEFGADVRLKLLENDCARLRKFEQRCKPRTYLTVVIQRLYSDYRNREWGKWQPSVAARKMGAVAERLETLLVRDRVPFEEACQQILTTERVATTRQQLEDIAIRLPHRTRRTQVDGEELTTVAAPDTFDDIPPSERAEAVRRLSLALGAAVQGLPPRDRLMLRMRFLDGLGIADIAQVLHCDARPLYRHFERLLRDLRSALERAGFHAAEANDIVSRQELDIILALITERAYGT
jgi:RNA polymerase sigma factor for flagellar operon FliA